MPENIINKHVAFFVTILGTIGDTRADEFDAITRAGAYCIKHDLSPNAYIKHVFANYDNIVGTVKTMSNDIGACIANIKKCGSVKAYEAKVDEYNARPGRSVFSHQTFAMKFGTIKVAPKKTVAKRPALSLAVKQGIITQAQAKALKALGF